MTKVELALTVAVPLLQTCLLILLFLTDARRRFRAFSYYTAFAVLSGVIEIGVHNFESLYFTVYWWSEAIYTVLKFLSLHEVFRSVFANFYAMRWFRLLFPAIGALLLAIAVARTLLHPSPDSDPATAIIIFSEIAVGILQIGIFGLLLLLVQFFRVRWRQQPFGIALGFGLSAAGTLVVFLLRSEFGTKFDPVVRITPPIAYTLAVLVWLLTFLVKEQAPAQTGVTSGLTPEQMISDVKRYTEAAKRIFRQ